MNSGELARPGSLTDGLSPPKFEKMSMDIGHLSDLHLGRRSHGDPYGSERLNSLRKAIAKLAEMSPDAVLIAGDVFDSCQVEKATIQEAAKILDKARKENGEVIPVVIVPGNHDPSECESLWRTFQHSLVKESAVHLALAPEVVQLCNGKLLIEAYPCETRYSPEAPWEKRLSLPDKLDGTVRVVLAHGTLVGGPVPEGENEAYPFTLAEVERLSAEYMALGHFHSVYPPWDGEGETRRAFCYSGTHEPDQFGGDSGYAVVATLAEKTVTRLRKIKVGLRQWRLVEISSPSDFQKIEALRNEVASSENPSRFVVRTKVSGKTVLAPAEIAKLDDEEGTLRALGAHVDRHGEFRTLVNLESLDLSLLPSGAVKEALIGLQAELLKTKDDTRREVVSVALQLGWEKLRKSE